MSVPEGLKELLIRLAERYETEEFIKDDPVQFPHEVAKRGGRQADMKTALEITDAMREIWPEDPTKGDFALFGYGVNHK